MTRLAREILPRGVMGCFLSHRSFWQYVVDNNLSQAIIMEDDVLLAANFAPRLSQALRELDTLHNSDTIDVMLLGALGK